MVRIPGVLLVSSVIILAGCLGPGEELASDDVAVDPDALLGDWWRDSLPFGDDHDHADVAQHAGYTTANFDIIGWDPLVTDELGTTAGGMGCGGAATRDDGTRLAVAHSFTSRMGVVIADVTDPEAPTLVGEYYFPNARVWDATISADGMHALIAADPAVPTTWELPTADELTLESLHDVPNAPVQPMFYDACTGEHREAGPEQYLPLAPMVVMVSLSDPTSPAFEDAVAQPVLGPHSVSSQLIDGTVYAISSVTNLVHEASTYTFFEIQADRLVPLSVITAPGVDAPGLNGHIDAELHKHPITGDVLAYLANWGQGVHIYDMNEPRTPMPVGAWTGVGSIHEALPLDELTADGRHLTIAGQEGGEPENDPSVWLFILDTTDPADPVELSRWTIPVKPIGWEWGLQFSLHYVEVVGDTLFVANYHGGLWAVDISEPEDPRTIGHFVPALASPAPGNAERGVSVEDVIADEHGTLTIWDGDGGIYQVRFDPGMPVRPAPPWDPASVA